MLLLLSCLRLPLPLLPHRLFMTLWPPHAVHAMPRACNLHCQRTVSQKCASPNRPNETNPAGGRGARRGRPGHLPLPPRQKGARRAASLEPAGGGSVGLFCGAALGGGCDTAATRVTPAARLHFVQRLTCFAHCPSSQGLGKDAKFACRHRCATVAGCNYSRCSHLRTIHRPRAWARTPSLRAASALACWPPFTAAWSLQLHVAARGWGPRCWGELGGCSWEVVATWLSWLAVLWCEA